MSAPSQPTTAQPVYLDSLNEDQRHAVEAVDGPVLVLAGAGTGKTRVLTTRLGHILMQGKASPWEILAVTFTNKAAREMQNRVSGLLGRETDGWWVGTFHALGARILRRHAEAVGLKSNFTILDSDDQIRLLKQLMAESGIDEKRAPARSLMAIIQRWKDRGLMPDKVSDTEESEAADGKMMALYGAYQERLQTLNAADFGDLLLLPVELFTRQPEVLEQYRNKFRYILVDEYQDTNVAQYLWLRLLARVHGNICCVGDDDQSIYSWRGAEVGNILRFEKDFPGAKVVRLERNYRSTPHILAAASGLISHNEGRLGKTLWTDLNDGDKVRVRGVWDGIEEARVVGDEIEAIHRRGEKLNEMAVLVRAGFQTREFEERLITLGVPYRVLGGARFYERMEIRDAIAYLRIIAQPDDDLAFERIVNTPKRGLGKSTMQALHQYARGANIPLLQASRQLIETDDLRPQARKALAGLLGDLDRWRGLAKEVDHTELMARVLGESGYEDMWRADKTPEAPGRLENLKELQTALEEFDDLAGFLEHISLVMENESSSSDDKVTLMTLHGAKGLEFDTVFLPGWEEGLFPHQRALDEGHGKALEEERRLAYVGLTRARKAAHVSFAANRRIYGNWQSAIPSRFVEELPADHVDVSAERGVYGGGFDNEKPRFRSSGRSHRTEPTWATTTSSGSGDFEIGQRIFHQKFGYGAIREIDGDKLEIAFEKAGTKKVMAGFVEET
ncbi:MAG: UvrD-helicase domain-containing protein [Rhodospirillaceae bacterium]|jgi:DNA helicase II / ATP-dependent DNA helicase PcrA|nr:UvrD-helicase domain-containing protein [Rhodospirillaceae bacterium]MBT4218670.1 UvrD-helicase domain-containing protein [Rhodospirillaceae bacterium]MBT5013244.1 UvrD-helicase domain-containing protein [Rhodospirillaceae bacterium]MBT6406987.1 UvrD-helicase domain-containing protein [Rhodospirillaceae bacterium]MBT7356917.1 UvrD-helicase domain-containing protein [Rhodospirillaceae bacterium]